MEYCKHIVNIILLLHFNVFVNLATVFIKRIVALVFHNNTLKPHNIKPCTIKLDTVLYFFDWGEYIIYLHKIYANDSQNNNAAIVKIR